MKLIDDLRERTFDYILQSVTIFDNDIKYMFKHRPVNELYPFKILDYVCTVCTK